MDAEQYGQHEGDDEAPRIRLRLDARTNHLLPGRLSLEPVVFLKALREGISLSQTEQSELVPQVCHRSGQRTSRERPLLLATRRYPGRAAPAGAVVPAHDPLLRRVVA